MTNATIAKRYALSLVQLGAENGQVDSYRTELEAIGALFAATPQLPDAFANPAILLEQRKNIMRELITACGCSGMVENFLLLLVDKNRASLIPQIVASYQELADEQSGILRPVITSAFELEEAQLSAICASLETKNRRSVVPRVELDPALLGGIVVQVGDTVYDSSIRTQLHRLQDQLLKG